jgi:hypothetical protein
MPCQGGLGGSGLRKVLRREPECGGGGKGAERCRRGDGEESDGERRDGETERRAGYVYRKYCQIGLGPVIGAGKCCCGQDAAVARKILHLRARRGSCGHMVAGKPRNGGLDTEGRRARLCMQRRAERASATMRAAVQSGKAQPLTSMRSTMLPP